MGESVYGTKGGRGLICWRMDGRGLLAMGSRCSIDGMMVFLVRIWVDEMMMRAAMGSKRSDEKRLAK